MTGHCIIDSTASSLTCIIACCVLGDGLCLFLCWAEIAFSCVGPSVWGNRQWRRANKAGWSNWVSSTTCQRVSEGSTSTSTWQVTAHLRRHPAITVKKPSIFSRIRSAAVVHAVRKDKHMQPSTEGLNSTTQQLLCSPAGARSEISNSANIYKQLCISQVYSYACWLAGWRNIPKSKNSTIKNMQM